MSTELIAIIGVGVALAGLMLNGQHTLRSETRAEFQVVRAETRAEFQAVRAEMREEFKAQREDINGLLGRMTHLEGRMAHLEGLLEGLREAIVSQSVAAARAVAKDPEHNSGLP